MSKTVDRIITAKGKGFVTLDIKSDRPDEDALMSALLGPSGNLRAPTLRQGKTLMVGFSEEAYQQLVGEVK